MANYNGARRKTTGGNRNAKSQHSETGGKNSYITQNSGSDAWSTAGRRPSRTTSDDGWGDIGRRPLRSTSDDGWGDIGRRPSNYTSDDLWGPLPSQSTVIENAWDIKGSRKNQKSHTSQGKKPVPLVGPNFSWDYEEYPVLESKPPVENVWEKRKEKLEGRKAMEPTNMTEEELMIQKAIELSKREAKEEEERRRLIEEEYELQNRMLATNPEFFSDFLTPDELTEANKSPETETEYQGNDFEKDYVEEESNWNCPEPVENQWSQKQSKKPGKKKKRNKSQSSTHMEDETTNQNAWSDNEKIDHGKQNETMLPKQIEYQEMQDNWSQNPMNENCYNKAEENESQFVDEAPDFSSELTSTASPNPDSESKLHKGNQPQISKVIDMFGGWSSKNTQNSILKSSYEQERFESYDEFSSANSVSNNEEILQDDWEKSKEISELDENVPFSKNSSNHRDVENFSITEKGQSSLNEENSWNSNYSSNDKQYNDELKHSLYSHVESSIAAPTSAFCNDAANSSNSGASFLSKKSVPKDDDFMNSIVQDYASLAVRCTDSFRRENVPIQRNSKDIFSSVATLLNEDNPKPDIIDLPHSSVDESQNLSIPVVNQTSTSEIMYSLNNTAPTEVSNKVPIENVAGPWNDSNIRFHPHAEINEMNNSLFLTPVNEAVKDVPNDQQDYSVDSAIPAPMQREAPFPCRPNPVMGNLIDPNLMMSLNPLMMQQMMMLNNPFFLQQLHQMQMYYTAMSMPFNSPIIPPMPPFNPILNNTMGNFFNGDTNSNMNPVPEQSVEINPSVPPPCYNFENEHQKSIPLKSDAPETFAVPNVEFENSLLTDLLSEGAAYMDMDSFIPPPTMPGTNPPKNPYPAPNVENEVDVNIAQDSLQSAYQNEAISRNSNCDMRNPKQECPTMEYSRTEDFNANARNVNSDNTAKSSVPDVAEASGWGDIGDMPKHNYASWNDNVDGWADEKVTTSKSMINSSRYASRKQTTVRQPIRQPRQTSQW